jgi:hypothetical protein
VWTRGIPWTLIYIDLRYICRSSKY